MAARMKPRSVTPAPYLQCKAPLVCPCPNGDGGTCGTTMYCLRGAGHSGRHRWDRAHECWHGQDAWCVAALPVRGRSYAEAIADGDV